MSKGNQAIVVRLEEKLRIRVAGEVNDVNRRRPTLEYSLSHFVREAIIEKLAHRERSRKTRKGKQYTCRSCKGVYDIVAVGSVMTLLTGEKEYTCLHCELGEST
jgi:predicted SprT family Zn-dependent metalloprotease